jgi:hypothetical protein
VLVSRIARMSPKKALASAAVAAATTGMVLTAAPAHAATTNATSAQAVAQKMIPDKAQYAAFSNIVSHESGWNVTATNASSGAYGLVQALPGSKMASSGSDWKTNPATQITWGLGYVKGRYDSPCGAWGYFQSNGHY